MKRYIEGTDRQSLCFPERLDDYLNEDNPVRIIDMFVEGLDLDELGFARAEPAVTGRPCYPPAVLLKLYVYGHLNRVQSSRRLEAETQRNVEVMWLTGRLMPDYKTIADFRKDNGKAIIKVCAKFVQVCRELGLLGEATVAIDGSKFKAVNNRDRNFTSAKMKTRLVRLEKRITRYLLELDEVDEQEREASAPQVAKLAERIAVLQAEQQRLERLEQRMLETPDQHI